MKRRGVIRIRKCRIVVLLVASWTLLCILLLISIWHQRQHFEEELLAQQQQQQNQEGGIQVPLRMPSQSQRESNGELVADADERTISGVQDERQMVTESMSSVDYFSCCGLGHRLSKMSDAHYVAKKRLNFQLRVFWATCQVASSSVNHNNQTNVEVFHYFFGAQPLEEIQELLQQQQQARKSNYTISTTTATRHHHNLRLHNEIPGFKKFKRQSDEYYYVPIHHLEDNSDASLPPSPPNIRITSQEECPYQKGEIMEDFFQETANFHSSLKQRFVSRHQTLFDYWRGRFQFSNHTVLGLHVRAGNGEKGDFLRKNRGVEDWEAWTVSMAELIAQMIRQEEWTITTTKPPLLFLATDTDSILHKLQEHLQGILPVVSLPQERQVDGSGVAFGNKVQVDEGECLEKWQNLILDMMLLSDVDIIIAGRPSSFTQSLPMSIALSSSRNHHHQSNDDHNTTTIKAPYCEVNRNATLYQCYSDFEDWCCNGKSSFHMEGIHPGYEYRRLPLALHQEDFSQKIQPRPSDVPLDPKLVRQHTPLPYDWAPIA
jgi:hypothetical protein